MKKALLFTVLLAIVLSCSKEQYRTIANGTFRLSLSAELPEMRILDNNAADGDTRASTHYTVRIKWAAGDRLSVINLTTGKILGGNLIANSSGTVTSFSGSLNGTVHDGDVITYFYPGQDNSSEQDFATIDIDMSEQTGTTGGVPLCVYSTNIAESESFDNVSLTFSYLMGYMMIGPPRR